MTTWDSAAAPVLGVVGPRGLSARLGASIGVRRLLLPSAASVEEVDAVVLARSATTGRGSWADALRPVGFDRGVALATALRTARERHLPVVLYEDAAPAERDGWDTLLDGAVDTALSPGPLGAGGVCWNPGLHWDVAALQQAVASAGAGLTARTGASAVALDGAEWRLAQRTAVASGAATAGDDPWSRHLAGEVTRLGVAVRDAQTDQLVPVGDDASPWAAAAWLCDHLGLPGPRRRPVALLHDTEPPHGLVTRLAEALGRDGWHAPSTAHLRASTRPDTAVVVPPADTGWDAATSAAAVACVAALDRLGGDADGIAVRFGATVAAGGGLAAALPADGAHAHLVAGAIDLEALL